MQRQGRINKLEQQQPCLHRNAEPSCGHRVSSVSSGAAPGQSLNRLLWLHSITTHPCLPRFCHYSMYVLLLPELIGETASQHSGCQSTIQSPPLRCRNGKWCVQLGLCCCWLLTAAPPVAGSGSLSSPLAPRGWQPLAMTTRLTCVHTEQSSHRLSHEACSVDLPSHRRFVNGSSHRLRRRACMHSRCPVVQIHGCVPEVYLFLDG